MLLCLCTLPIIADTETLPKLLMLDVDVWGASSCDLYLWTAAWHTLRYNMFVHVYVLHGHTFCIDCTLYALWSVCMYYIVTPSALTLHTLCFVALCKWLRCGGSKQYTGAVAERSSPEPTSCADSVFSSSAPLLCHFSSTQNHNVDICCEPQESRQQMSDCLPKV